MVPEGGWGWAGGGGPEGTLGGEPRQHIPGSAVLSAPSPKGTPLCDGRAAVMSLQVLSRGEGTGAGSQQPQFLPSSVSNAPDKPLDEGFMQLRFNSAF